MATRKSSSTKPATKNTKTPAKTKRSQPMSKAAAAASAKAPSPTLALVELVIETFPSIPQPDKMVESLMKRGIEVSLSTARTVRDQARRVLVVLQNKNQFTPAQK